MKYDFYFLDRTSPVPQNKSSFSDVSILNISKCFGIGPNNWGNVNEKCDGTKQSPIDIATTNVVKTANTSLFPLMLGQHWSLAKLTNFAFTLKNINGKTAQLEFVSNNSEIITATQGGRILRIFMTLLNFYDGAFDKNNLQLKNC